MILQALYDYYQRKCAAPNPADRLPAYGLEEKEIPFVLEITTEGELVNLRDEGRRKVFVFRDRATRRADVMAFYGDATSVRPLAFAATIKDMKGLLHNG